MHRLMHSGHNEINQDQPKSHTPISNKTRSTIDSITADNNRTTQKHHHANSHQSPHTNRSTTHNPRQQNTHCTTRGIASGMCIHIHTGQSTRHSLSSTSETRNFPQAPSISVDQHCTAKQTKLDVPQHNLG